MLDLTKKLLDLAHGERLNNIILANPFISSSSRWKSPKWRLTGIAPGKPPSKIAWRSEEFPPGVLDELKLIAASLFLKSGERAPPLKHSNSSQFSLAAHYLARFMLEKSFDSIAELDVEAFNEFVSFLRRDASKPTMPIEHLLDLEVEPEATGPEPRKEIEIDRQTYNFVTVRLKIWQWMQMARVDLVRAGIPITLGNVFAKETLPKLAERISIDSLNTMEDLPDAVVVPVLNEAHRLLGEPAEQVIELIAKALALGPSKVPPGVSDRRALLERQSFTIGGETSPWFEAAESKSLGLVVHELVRLIRDACMIVLAAGIGWRISESASLEVDEREDNEALPSCIFITRSITGTSEHFWVRGLLSKHQPEPTAEDWLIGARLAGSRAEPMTVRAIRVLERLYRPWRRMSDRPILRQQLVLEWRGAGLAYNGRNLNRIMAGQLRISSQEWMKKRVKLKQLLADQVGNDPRLAPYADSDGECIRPHQWRRTFFRLMFRMDNNLLPAISRHFKHISLATTENDYAPRSPAALEDQEAVATNELVALLFARGEGETKPATGGDKILARHRRALASIIDGDDVQTAAPRLAKFAAHRGLRLWPGEHGKCLIGLNPDRAACHVRGGKIDWRADRPNPRTRNPSLCCSCPNLVITIHEAGFWQRRYRTYRSAWIASGKDPAFRASRDRARQARTILDHLGELPDDLINDEEHL